MENYVDMEGRIDMGMLSGMMPSDVRQVIDRTDEKIGAMDARLAVIADLISEQNSLLSHQNVLLTKLLSRKQ